MEGSCLCFQSVQCACLQLIVSEGAKFGLYVGDQTLPIENAARASVLQLECVPKHCYEEGQCQMTTFIFTCSKLPFVDVEELRCNKLTVWFALLFLDFRNKPMSCPL